MVNIQLPTRVQRGVVILLLCLPFAASADLLLISRVSNGGEPAKAAYLLELLALLGFLGDATAVSLQRLAQEAIRHHDEANYSRTQQHQLPPQGNRQPPVSGLC